MEKDPQTAPPRNMRIHAIPGDQARSSNQIFSIIFNYFCLIAMLHEEATGARRGITFELLFRLISDV